MKLEPFKKGDRVWWETGNNDLLGTVTKVESDKHVRVRLDLGRNADEDQRIHVGDLTLDTSGEVQS